MGEFDELRHRYWGRRQVRFLGCGRGQDAVWILVDTAWQLLTRATVRPGWYLLLPTQPAACVWGAAAAAEAGVSHGGLGGSRGGAAIVETGQGPAGTNRCSRDGRRPVPATMGSVGLAAGWRSWRRAKVRPGRCLISRHDPRLARVRDAAAVAGDSRSRLGGSCGNVAAVTVGQGPAGAMSDDPETGGGRDGGSSSGGQGRQSSCSRRQRRQTGTCGSGRRRSERGRRYMAVAAKTREMRTSRQVSRCHRWLAAQLRAADWCPYDLLFSK